MDLTCSYPHTLCNVAIYDDTISLRSEKCCMASFDLPSASAIFADLKILVKASMPIIAFSRKRCVNVPRLLLDNVYIDFVQEFRYLGVLLHRRLNWSKHCKAMRSKALQSLGSLIPLMKSPLPLNLKLLLYKAYIRPQMTYASPAWAFISKKNTIRLEVVQNKALRIIGGYD